jgi:hypothetical protein
MKTLSMADQPTGDPEIVHHFKNYVSIIMGFCDLLLSEMPADAPQRADILEIRKAAEAAMGLIPELARRID